MERRTPGRRDGGPLRGVRRAIHALGRSYAESPDIDGRIYFSAPRDVAAGEFVPVRITGAMDGELTGELAEE
ncbi:MAG: hypothetical protein ACLSAB_07085 [Oscillospiraceae bacterium]